MQAHPDLSKGPRLGLTLVEVLIVVVIMAILAGAIVPSFVDSTINAEESTLRHDLSVIRGAIQRYRMDHEGQLPGLDKKSDTFKADMRPYLLRGVAANPFAKNEKRAAEISIKSKGNPLKVSGNKGWAYDNVTGQFIANSDAVSSDGVTKYSEF